MDRFGIDMITMDMIQIEGVPTRRRFQRLLIRE